MIVELRQGRFMVRHDEGCNGWCACENEIEFKLPQTLVERIESETSEYMVMGALEVNDLTAAELVRLLAPYVPKAAVMKAVKSLIESGEIEERNGVYSKVQVLEVEGKLN